MKFFIVAIASVVLFFPAFWLFASVVGPDWGAGIAAVGMYIAFPVLLLKVWGSTEESDTSDAMSLALQNGSLSSEDFSVSSAIEIENSAFPDLHFLLDIGDEKTLSLKGEYLYGPIERGVFPCSLIRVYWDKDRNHTCGVQCMGNSLFPLQAIQADVDADSSTERLPNDREVFSQSLSLVVATLKTRA